MALDVLGDVLQGHSGRIYRNLPVPRLVEMALARGEGALTASGALRVVTGKYTGRSPDDKFIVETPEVAGELWWQNNKKMSEKAFNGLYRKVVDHLKAKDVFVFEGSVGADAAYAIPVRVINEFAWQNLFVRHLFIRKDIPGGREKEAGFTLIAAPGCTADPEADGTHSEAFIVINLTQRVILVGGTHYAGEMKKAIFSVSNYLLPRQGILSMHCSANKGVDNDVALFFGLSGTGKTSLSADSDRLLIGDDEHGWSDNGIFNVEGGCYAKCIRLNRENEPQIWEAIRFGSVVENVAMDDVTRELDYDNEEITENSRVAYPIEYIPNSVHPSVGGHPSTVIFLTADAFGVLPAIARLNPEQAMYYFLSGYTSKLAGTERGIVEPQATFSACFGAPFLPLPPLTYANLLREKISQHNTRVFLINTGWQGGAYGIGKRISIQYTRRMVSSAINGYLDFVDYVNHPVFNLAIPAKCPGVPDDILMPQNTWADQEAYRVSAERLAAMFHKNFVKFSGMPADVSQSGPFLAVTEQIG
jgi:phosphoenolpyruvate carboxykinase (ATP)